MIEEKLDHKEPTSEALLCEYQENASSMRHYANMQFAQMSVFVAVTGGIIAAIIQNETRELDALKWMLSVAGALVGLLFALMSLRVSEYWDKHVTRAKVIEEKLGLESFRAAPAARSGVQNRTAVIAFYILIAATLLIVAHVV